MFLSRQLAGISALPKDEITLEVLLPENKASAETKMGFNRMAIAINRHLNLDAWFIFIF